MKQTEIRLEKPGHFISAEGTLGEIPENHARIRIRRIGVCGTDIHAFHGRQPFFDYPRILGHELGAEVLETNGDSDFSAGDLVAVEPYLSNPKSPASRAGKPNCCEELRVMGVHSDGGMRPFLDVPLSLLHRAGTASLDQLALVEMLGIGRHAVNRAQPTTGEKTLLLGAGPIGLSILSFLRLETDDIVVADINEGRLEFCRSAFGVSKTITLPAKRPFEEELRNNFDGELPTLILDATGNSQSMHSTFPLIAHGGKIVFVGLFQGEVTFDDPNFHRREITLLASRNSTPTEFGQVIQAIEDGAIDTNPWITHRLPLEEVPGKFGDMIADPTLRKAVLHLDG